MTDRPATPVRQATLDEIPVIDIAPLLDNTPGGLEAVAAAIGQACRGIGFFYLRGHGVAPAMVAGVMDDAKTFFALPTEAKQPLSIENSSQNRGYVALGRENLDPSQPADRKEAFNIGLDLAPDDPEILAGVRFRGVNKWPDLPGWRARMVGYHGTLTRLCVRLHEAFAHDLGVPASIFTDVMDRPIVHLRLLHYPAETQTGVASRPIGAGAHSDYGNITLLVTDGTPGLEVKTRSGEWVAAPHIPDTFVCNIGDMLMRWSNDTYVSTPHRVVNRAGLERYSAALFFEPNPDAMVACLPSCQSPDNPPRYAPVSCADYLASRLAAAYDHIQSEP